MAIVPKKITVDMAARRMYVDGVEFPYEIDGKGPWIGGVSAVSKLRTVTITMIADDVEVTGA